MTFGILLLTAVVITTLAPAVALKLMLDRYWNTPRPAIELRDAPPMSDPVPLSVR